MSDETRRREQQGRVREFPDCYNLVEESFSTATLYEPGCIASHPSVTEQHLDASLRTKDRIVAPQALEAMVAFDLIPKVTWGLQ